jgi:hypothetical protein
MDWVEPRGESNNWGSKGSNTIITGEHVVDAKGNTHFAKPRRFLIIATFQGHCSGLYVIFVLLTKASN